MTEVPVSRGGEQETSYLGEFLRHQYTLYGLLGSLAMSTLLAIPYDLGVAALPLVGFAGATSMAALFVPSSAHFRNWVNRKNAAKRREAVRSHLIGELTSRQGGAHPNWNTYHRLVARVGSLRALSHDRKTALTATDVDKLDDATLDYLGLWLAGLSMGDRHHTLHDQNLEARLARVDEQLASAPAGDRGRLEKARSDLERLLRSRKRIESHATAVDANMLAMADAFEEVYQGIMSNPGSNDAGSQLQAAVDRIRIEEDLGNAIEDDIGELLPNRQAQRAQVRARQGG